MFVYFQVHYWWLIFPRLLSKSWSASIYWEAS